MAENDLGAAGENQALERARSLLEDGPQALKSCATIELRADREGRQKVFGALAAVCDVMRQKGGPSELLAAEGGRHLKALGAIAAEAATVTPPTSRMLRTLADEFAAAGADVERIVERQPERWLTAWPPLRGLPKTGETAQANAVDRRPVYRVRGVVEVAEKVNGVFLVVLARSDGTKLRATSAGKSARELAGLKGQTVSVATIGLGGGGGLLAAQVQPEPERVATAR